MSISKISPDDPKLTAYALGELEGEERAAFETALRGDATAQAAVEEIRAMAGQITSALATESLENESDTHGSARAAIVPGSDPRKLDGGPYARGGTGLGKMIRFPQSYFIVGGLAAACFAIFVALRPQPDLKVNKVYTEVALAPSAVPSENGSADKAVVAGILAEEKQAKIEGLREDALQEARAMQARQRPGRGERFGAGVRREPTSPPSPLPLRLEPKDRAEVENTAAVPQLETFSVAPSAASPSAAITGGRALSAASFATGRPAARVRGDQPTTDAFAYQSENDFLGATENPLSTFSIDVDTAGYSMMRRFIEGGRLPPTAAVRIEELVNYFPYRYAPPAGDAPFAASMEVADAPWAPTHRLVRIGLKGREVATAARPAANLVFLLDVSGSMDEPNKLPLVKESMRLLVGKLRPDDRVAIVVYAGASGLALPSTTVKHAAEIIGALDRLEPGGSTNGAMGIQLAYDIAKANFVPGGVNRVILCTDGDFNVGVTNEAELTTLITEKAKSGVFLTALGFGMGNFKDATLEKLADKGNGNYGYIDTRREAEKLLVEQVNGTLMTIAKDVKIQVEFNPAQVASYRLVGYENRMLKKEDFNNDAVDAGEIGAGHTVTALYEIVPVGAEEKATAATPAVDPLRYRKDDSSDGKFRGDPVSGVRDPQSPELLTLKVRYKEPAGDVSRKLEFPLVDAGEHFPKATADFKFAAAVAEFGMILRDSPHKGSAKIADVIAMAEAGTETDAGGYRAEFVELVRKAEKLIE